MKQIILDCDNTAGLPGYPMDDALALLYLLGRPERAALRAVTCAFGNGTVAQVHRATARLLSEIGRKEIPLLPGAERNEDPRSPAARHIAALAEAHPGEISVLAIGGLRNLYGAYLLNDKVFDQLREVVLMGGYTAPLLYHGRHLDELNFSSDPKAACCVLRRGKNVSVITGNNSLAPSRLPREEFLQRLGAGGKAGRYIAGKLGYRFSDRAERCGAAVSYCWDAVTAVYLLHPELFTDCPTPCYVTEQGMCAGWLGPTQAAPDTCLLNLPQVRDLAAYREEMYGGWLAFRLAGEGGR